MARTNIFEKLKANFDLIKEVNRIYDLVFKQTTIKDFYDKYYIIERFVDAFCFQYWSNRGHCLNLDDFLNDVGFEEIYQSADKNVDAFIAFVEICANLYMLALRGLTKFHYDVTPNFGLLKDIIDDDLAHFNHKTYYDEEAEQLIVVENDPAVTAVVEIEDDSGLASDIVRYNHHTLKGDLAKKKAVLLMLGTQLEPQRKQLKTIDSHLESDIFFLLNNMNLRHNNTPSCDSKSKPVIAALPPEELESWYDELYQMLLLAKLELDNIERNKKVNELKSKFSN